MKNEFQPCFTDTDLMQKQAYSFVFPYIAAYFIHVEVSKWMNVERIPVRWFSFSDIPAQRRWVNKKKKIKLCACEEERTMRQRHAQVSKETIFAKKNQLLSFDRILRCRRLVAIFNNKKNDREPEWKKGRKWNETSFGSQISGKKSSGEFSMAPRHVVTLCVRLKSSHIIIFFVHSFVLSSVRSFIVYLIIRRSGRGGGGGGGNDQSYKTFEKWMPHAASTAASGYE